MANANNVTVGKPAVGGAIYSAPAGTSLPNDATTTLASAFTSLGYVSEEGLTNSRNIESAEFKAWGGDTVQSAMTGSADKFKFKLIEAINLDVLKEIYGSANVTGTLSTGATVNVKAAAWSAKVWAVDTILTGGALKRIVLPNAKITEVGDIVYADGEVVGYEVTLLAQPDTSGNTHYEYIKTSA